MDAEPVRQHVRQLQASGLGYRRIAALAGTSEPLIFRLLHGVKSTGKPPTKNLRTDTAESILAVQPNLEAVAEYAKIDGAGTRRRLQALVAHGWAQNLIAAEIGMTPGNLARVIRTPEVTAKTARLVRAVYERMWDAAPPQSTVEERSAFKRAKTIASRYGWAPSMAWDDIDDPAEQPQGVARPNLRRRLPHVDELAWLMDQGETQEAIAMRFTVHVKSLKSAQIRANRKAAA
ncbi:hypothetical protein [Glycomyces sp. NPDC021274]|uniref:hypothetical protein n=1 Tax=Glycomyces sp. NPDC021274 TaxID=3155120 RepID=UPI0033F0E06F